MKQSKGLIQWSSNLPANPPPAPVPPLFCARDRNRHVKVGKCKTNSGTLVFWRGLNDHSLKNVFNPRLTLVAAEAFGSHEKSKNEFTNIMEQESSNPTQWRQYRCLWRLRRAFCQNLALLGRHHSPLQEKVKVTLIGHKIWPDSAKIFAPPRNMWSSCFVLTHSNHKKTFYLYQVDLSGADWSKLVVQLFSRNSRRVIFLGHSVDLNFTFCHFDFPSAESWQRVQSAIK